MVLGGLGACPQGILRFYMLWGMFWGLLRLLFLACIQYIHTFKLLSLFSSLMYGALVNCTVVLHKIKCALNCVSSINEAKKQADLKSTIQWNEALREARLGCEWRTRFTWSYLNEFSTVWGPLTLLLQHWLQYTIKHPSNHIQLAWQH